MNHNHRHLINVPESGQTVVLFALSIIGLIAFVGLAVDGGNVLNERRKVQNAADASALRGVHYIASSDAPDETSLCATVNRIVESNGVADTDNFPGNAINDNVQIVYTDDAGETASIAEADGGPQVDCDNPRPSIPAPAEGVEVFIDTQTDTYFLGVIGRDTLDVGSRAVAVIKGQGGPASNLDGNALVAFGNCDQEDDPLHFSAYYIDVIGDVHSDTYFANTGSENHYHGEASYVEGYRDPADISGVYDGGLNETDETMGDPFADLNLSVDRFHCTDGDIGSAADKCYDLTQHSDDMSPFAGVSTKLLKQNSPPGSDEPYLDEATGKLQDGIYYAGDYPFFIGVAPGEVGAEEGEPGLHGTVTLVTNSYIKITENDVQLSSYMDSDTVVPGLLLYSGLDMTDEGKACTNHEDLTDEERPINTTGNAGTVPPRVWHSDDRAGCVSPDDATCYEMGSLQYNGILYAPGGRIATSGHGASYRGAVVGYSVRVNGYIEFCEPEPGVELTPPCRPGENAYYDNPDNYEDPADVPPPDQVGALFVYDYAAAGATESRIYLEE